MTLWAEVRHLHLVEDVPKREIARRLKLDVKTVRRAISQPVPPARVSPRRPSSLDPWRERIMRWLREEPKVTVKRIHRLLLPLAGPVPARTVRRYVAEQRAAVAPKEAFVNRSVRPGTTLEVDFGESWVDIAGVAHKVKYLVATLPFSNAYFAKAYAVERLESLLDGIESASRYYGGVVDRVVLDNTWRAEQAIRPAVVTRKVCGGNRTRHGADTQQVLASVVRTAHQRDLNLAPLIATMLRATNAIVPDGLQRPPPHLTS